MHHRPQTLYGIEDSPVGLAAWMLDHDADSYALIAREELYQAPRSWAERAYPKLVHYNRLDKGGHFAAWEQPKVFAQELRAGFKSLR